MERSLPNALSNKGYRRLIDDDTLDNKGSPSRATTTVRTASAREQRRSRLQRPGLNGNSSNNRSNHANTTESLMIPDLAGTQPSREGSFYIFVLLLRPITKSFELIHFQYPPSTTTFGNIMEFIPLYATEVEMAAQKYTGFTRPQHNRSSNKTKAPKCFTDWSALAQESGVTCGEILVAIPEGYTSEQVVSVSSSILSYRGVRRALKRRTRPSSASHLRSQQNFTPKTRAVASAIKKRRSPASSRRLSPPADTPIMEKVIEEEGSEGEEVLGESSKSRTTPTTMANGSEEENDHSFYQAVLDRAVEKATADNNAVETTTPRHSTPSHSFAETLPASPSYSPASTSGRSLWIPSCSSSARVAGAARGDVCSSPFTSPDNYLDDDIYITSGADLDISDSLDTSMSSSSMSTACGDNDFDECSSTAKWCASFESCSVAKPNLGRTSIQSVLQQTARSQHTKRALRQRQKRKRLFRVLLRGGVVMIVLALATHYCRRYYYYGSNHSHNNQIANYYDPMITHNDGIYYLSGTKEEVAGRPLGVWGLIQLLISFFAVLKLQRSYSKYGGKNRQGTAGAALGRSSRKRNSIINGTRYSSSFASPTTAFTSSSSSSSAVNSR